MEVIRSKAEKKTISELRFVWKRSIIRFTESTGFSIDRIETGATVSNNDDIRFLGEEMSLLSEVATT
jgi:hypothetical protein